MAVKHEANAAPREISRRGGPGKGLNGLEVLAGGAVSGRQTDIYTVLSYKALQEHMCRGENFRPVPEWFFEAPRVPRQEDARKKEQFIMSGKRVSFSALVVERGAVFFGPRLVSGHTSL